MSGLDLELLARALPGGAEEAEAAACYQSFYRFAKRAWREIDPAPFIDGWHVKALADHLQAVFEGDIDRLIINMPPGLGKSMFAGVLWPAWCWIKRPSWQLLTASYEVQLATRDAVKCRELMRSHWYTRWYRSKQSPFCKPWDFAADQDLKTFYRNTAKGHRQALGVGGKGTGYRGSCLAGETLVSTERGQIRIDDLCAMRERPRVWTFNHETGQAELTEIVATSVRNARVRLVDTVAGSSLRCSNEHPIYSNGAYHRSDNLREGDPLLTCGRADLPPVPAGIQATRIRLEEAVSAGGDALLLFPIMLDGSHQHEARQGDLLCQVWGAGAQGSGEAARRPEILPAMPAPARKQGGDPLLQTMQQALPEKLFSSPILHQRMREQSTQLAHDRQGELALQNGCELCAMVSVDAPLDYGARRVAMCELQDPRERLGHGLAGPDALQKQSSDPPHRRSASEQHREQSSDTLQLVPHHPPQVKGDAVALVGGLGDRDEPVYDLQVARNSNFFANAILVHNSLLIDDPISAKDAHSKIQRDAVIRWKDETMSSRFNDKANAKQVLIMQRLHEEDLSGHLLRQGGWEHLRLPALFEKENACTTYRKDGREFHEDPRTEEGELLFPPLLSRDVLARLKVECGSYGFAGQYQQRPAPAEGGILKREWFNRRWTLPGVTPPEGFECRTVPTRYDALAFFVDAAFKGADDSDFVAIGVVGVKGPDVYLLQLAWEQMTFSNTCVRLLDLHGKWAGQGLAGIYIEDKANGSAIIDTLKGKVPGIIPIEPDGGKESRINAAAPFIEAGNLWLPLTAPWVEDYITEAISFPKAPHDDAIDMTAYALLRYCGRIGANFLEQLSRAPGFA